ncbi:hypothetical protein GCM10017655_06680 [Pseudomonas turukhanskensis]|uniref:Uncharacterized protein n=1 Tax=Pseudomonas turukhanskensis TaxID=1806536 RepID=A0A9W6K3L3_9PSED|nr:hypothetical protein GCM10017655_06680 [Pseudomonas turukhanskensis]
MARSTKKRVLGQLPIKLLAGLALGAGAERAPGFTKQATQLRAGEFGGGQHGVTARVRRREPQEAALLGASNACRNKTPRRAAVGLALEPESSRWRLQGALRLSVRRTCTPAPTCNPRVCAYRLRDITNWRTLQGAAASIPE